MCWVAVRDVLLWLCSVCEDASSCSSIGEVALDVSLWGGLVCVLIMVATSVGREVLLIALVTLLLAVEVAPVLLSDHTPFL